jgi:hypothetical protein
VWHLMAAVWSAASARGQQLPRLLRLFSYCRWRCHAAVQSALVQVYISSIFLLSSLLFASLSITNIFCHYTLHMGSVFGFWLLQKVALWIFKVLAGRHKSEAILLCPSCRVIVGSLITSTSKFTCFLFSFNFIVYLHIFHLIIGTFICLTIS